MVGQYFEWILPGGCALVAIAYLLAWHHNPQLKAAAWAGLGAVAGVAFTAIDLARDALPYPAAVIIAPLQWLALAFIAQAMFARHGFSWHWPKLALGLAAPSLVHAYFFIIEPNIGVRLTQTFLVWGLIMAVAAFRLWREARNEKLLDRLMCGAVGLSAAFYFIRVWSLPGGIISHADWVNSPMMPMLYIGTALVGLAVTFFLMMLIGMDLIGVYFKEARVDPLTGVGNRRAFDDAIAADSAGHAPLGAALVVDLDRFKAINDELGHAVGDSVLAAVGQALDAQLSKEAMVSRIGGEEFAILIPALRREAAAKLAQLAHDAIGTTSCAGLDRPLSCSVGLAVRQPNEAIRETLHRADAALYRAKAEGRNRVVSACEFSELRAAA